MRIAAGWLAATLSLGVAGAADTETYTITGTQPGGAAYSGTVTLTERTDVEAASGDVFDIVWTINGQQATGVGLLDADRKVLTVAYATAAGPGVSSLTQAGGGISGVWISAGDKGSGTEIWTPAGAAAAPGPTAAPGALTYDRAVECAAVTSYVVGMLRSTPGADAAKITAYDQANSAWIMKLTDFPEGGDMGKNIDAIAAKQQVWGADPDGLTKATPIADDCVATAPPTGG